MYHGKVIQTGLLKHNNPNYIPRKDTKPSKGEDESYRATMAFPVRSKKYKKIIGNGPVV